MTGEFTAIRGLEWWWVGSRYMYKNFGSPNESFLVANSWHSRDSAYGNLRGSRASLSWVGAATYSGKM